jgi:acyl-CoA synthetase (AMP-forming)/AMP-acid ligase II
MALHFADCWELIADRIPDRPAIVQGARIVSWADYEDRAARLSSVFDAHGLGQGRNVGMFLYNCPEYLETQFAAFKTGATPVNVNYRYLEDELAYLLDNADVVALAYHSSLGPRVAAVRDRLPRLELLIEVDDRDGAGDVAAVDGSRRYEDVIASSEPAPRHQRDLDDVYMLYTGGTTGMPKGVMYLMGDFTRAWLEFASANLGRSAWESAEELAAWVGDQADAGGLTRTCPGPPLMHGTGVWLGAMMPHLTGGCVVLLNGRGLDPAEIVAVASEGLAMLVIVGDAFAKPIVAHLDECRSAGSPIDLSKLAVVLSSGAMLSADTKEALLDHAPHLVIIDALGSSEGSMGSRISVGRGSGTTAKFEMTPGSKVFDENDREVVPGSGVIGRVAATGTFLPVGYYKDPEKSAATFRTIDGVRYSFPGDMATVEADGSISFLGRGSQCVNTGGEKVFVEEVEEAIKTHPAVVDCLVFGVDGERFGQRVAAVASIHGSTATSEELIAHCKEKLAPYKAPRELRIVEQVPRGPNGKADYKAAKALLV